MIIFDENTKPILIDSINTPLRTNYFWILDLEEQDFKLQKIEMLEEHITPILVLSIFGYAIELPSDWNILIVSPETNQLDLVEVSELTRGHFQIFVYKHENNKIAMPNSRIIHYEERGILQMPSVSKNQMLCHAIGPDSWVCISPVDNYNKYIKGLIANDLIY